MLKRIGMGALAVFTFFCGMGMIEMGITEPDFETASRVFMGICGLLVLFGGAAIGSIAIEDLPRKSSVRSFWKSLKGEVGPDYYRVTADYDETEKRISAFRCHFSEFFDRAGIMENSPVQDDVTQIYWHTLFLQKRRLDRKGILSRMESERMGYGDLAPVRKHSFFDGKYQICDLSETIEARQTYLTPEGKTLYTKKAFQTAWYRLLNARRQGADGVVCPNCGSTSTRENLIDGCDYCGTKFTIEDLDEKIADFCFRADYEAEYARYTGVRGTYGKRVGLAVGIPVFLFCLFGALSAAGDIEGPYTLRVAAVMFAAAFPTFAAVFFGEILFFLTVFPILQARASLTRFGKKRMEEMKRTAGDADRAAKKIRSFDGLFSLTGFYADVQNKLAVLHFSESGKEAAAFAESEKAEREIEKKIRSYRDLIDLETEEICLEDYQNRGGLQEAGVRADLVLLSEKNGRVRKSRERVRLRLVKSAACRTQAVCAPSFTVCKKCGASMSLMEGRICAFCGDERRLSDTDWAIRSYEIV